MPTRNVNLSQQQARFIRSSIDDGRYRNASEVVRAGLRVLEQNEQQDKLKLRALRRLAKQGFDDIDRGRFEAVDSGGLDQFMSRMDAKARPSRRR
jgi:antitoxin ParD1/3/4